MVTETVQIKASGMMCSFCTMSVEKALKKLPGVNSVLVNLVHGVVLVVADTSKTSKQALANAVHALGYPVSETEAQQHAKDLAFYTMVRWRGLLSLQPPRARVLRGGAEVEVDIKQVSKGETVMVRPGERIPLDGEVARGLASVDESSFTGESAAAARISTAPPKPRTVRSPQCSAGRSSVLLDGSLSPEHYVYSREHQTKLRSG